MTIKYTLTIENAMPGDIANILSAVSGISVGVATAPVTPPSDDDDDDSAPTAPVTPGELDSAGFPHDERIHSKNASKNADGTWRKRKGVKAEDVTAVEAELRAAITPPTPSAPAVPAEAPAPAPAAPVTPPQAPAAPAAPAPAPAAPTDTGVNIDFSGFMQVVSNGMMATPPLIDDAFIAWLNGQLGVGSLPEIANDTAKIQQGYDLLKTHGRIAG